MVPIYRLWRDEKLASPFFGDLRHTYNTCSLRKDDLLLYATLLHFFPPSTLHYGISCLYIEFNGPYVIYKFK
ncbi:hypothetical protein RB195_019154 [Necator americanus]|uniref:Uncharacterized protein n=1 Tax=Necator americanus TaxID=51031 RepID=A0ABR1CEV0_NECAM